MKKVASLKNTTYQLATPEEESAGIDGYVGEKPVSIKPTTYKTKDMYGEKIEADATLGEALHSFVIGHHQSLLVTRGEEIVGILRLVDVFKLVCERIKTCGI